MMDTSCIDYLGIDRVLKRGTGEIIEDRDEALFVHDTVSGAYFLACENKETGLSLLDRHVGRGIGLLMVSNAELGRMAFERYGFSEKLECYQVAYYGDPPAENPVLRIREADKSGLPALTQHYHLISPEEMEKIVDRGNMFLGYDGDQLVGFIGEHLEGSMGLLYILPEFRRKGFAAALEKHYLLRTMEKGFVPFGQVEKDNQGSLMLQKKLNMTQSDQLIIWMWI